jgi:hypothetical protein
MKKKAGTVVLILILHLLGLSAQQDERQLDYEPSKLIAFVPQYLINNGIRIDYDIRIKNNHWLQLAPQFYLREKGESSPDQSTEDFTQLYGGGLYLHHRRYISPAPGENGSYLSYGVGYNYFYLSYDEKHFSNYTQRYSRINKFGGEVTIGMVATIQEVFVLDFYAGLGVRYSMINSDADNPKHFDDFYPDFGYTGNVILLGLRIGLLR